MPAGEGIYIESALPSGNISNFLKGKYIDFAIGKNIEPKAYRQNKRTFFDGSDSAVAGVTAESPATAPLNYKFIITNYKLYFKHFPL